LRTSDGVPGSLMRLCACKKWRQVATRGRESFNHAVIGAREAQVDGRMSATGGYRALVSPERAAAFWAVYPALIGGGVI